MENGLLRFWLRRDATFEEVESWVMGLAGMRRPSADSYRLTHEVIGDLLSRGLVVEVSARRQAPRYRPSGLLERLRAERHAELCRAAGAEDAPSRAVVANVIELGSLPYQGVLSRFRHALGSEGADAAAERAIRRLVASRLFSADDGELRCTRRAERLLDVVSPPAAAARTRGI